MAYQTVFKGIDGGDLSADLSHDKKVLTIELSDYTLQAIHFQKSDVIKLAKELRRLVSQMEDAV